MKEIALQLNRILRIYFFCEWNTMQIHQCPQFGLDLHFEHDFFSFIRVRFHGSSQSLFFVYDANHYSMKEKKNKKFVTQKTQNQIKNA